MPTQQLSLYENELSRIGALCAALHGSTDAQAVILVDKNGQFIASHGDVSGFDTTSLASLTAGNMASTQGLAKLIGENEFPSVYHEGKNESLLLSVVAHQAILVVMFGQRTTLGLVRLRSKKTCEALGEIFNSIDHKAQVSRSNAPFAQITDEDIDNLFGR
jgi:predicted regulator of Ras-like GTPase activity (Roadblock/LC7/MglB family)